VGGIPEVIIENETGSLVPARSPSILAKKILETLDDLPGARERACAGRELVHRLFDVHHCVADLVRAYENVLHRREVRLAG
jgi:glycosyltransferase involved in cell wall biosynthesis